MFLKDEMPFKMNKIICVRALPKFFRHVTRSTIIFFYLPIPIAYNDFLQIIGYHMASALTDLVTCCSYQTLFCKEDIT